MNKSVSHSNSIASQGVVGSLFKAFDPSSWSTGHDKRALALYSELQKAIALYESVQGSNAEEFNEEFNDSPRQLLLDEAKKLIQTYMNVRQLEKQKKPKNTLGFGGNSSQSNGSEDDAPYKIPGSLQNLLKHSLVCQKQPADMNKEEDGFTPIIDSDHPKISDLYKLNF